MLRSRQQKNSFLIASALGLVALVSGLLHAYSPEIPLRVVGLGFDAPREREHFQAYADRVARLRDSKVAPAVFEFIAVNLSDDDEVARVIPMMLKNPPAVVVAGNWGLAKAVQSYSKTIPIVFLAMAEPTDAGIVEKEGRPQTNATGVTLSAPIVESQLDWLLASVPSARRLLIISDKWWEENRARSDLMAHLATRPEISYEVRRVDSLQQAEALMQTIDPSSYDVWFFPAGYAAFIAESQWIEFVTTRRIAAAFTSERWGDQAGIVSYQEDRSQFRERMAEYIDAALRGRDVREMAVDRPSRFTLTVNLRLARNLGLIVPDDVILNADRILR